uniref:Uncharacterized protein n=1 Tax=Nelumbo nucifera TaxID=4432 RepID=A0A822YUN8_NELNU|nr:TPA_asm: hypothetical protein HUJ06_006907 [Nelumbo nucifera]
MRYACQFVLYIYFPFIGKVTFFYMFFLHKNILAIEAEKKENKIHTHTRSIHSTIGILRWKAISEW